MSLPWRRGREATGGLTRRELLITGLWAGLVLGPVRLLAATPGASERATLRAFLDTLLPADAHSPAASALGVDERLFTAAKSSRGRRALLSGGCTWLNTQAGGDFTALDDDQRQRLVAWMAQDAPGQGPRVFYEHYRDAAIRDYYAHAEAWAGTPLPHAPQPRGYREALMALERADG